MTNNIFLEPNNIKELCDYIKIYKNKNFVISGNKASSYVNDTIRNADIIISTLKLKNINYNEGDTITVDAGVTISDIIYYLKEKNIKKCLHTTPAIDFCTIGACYFTKIHGSSKQYNCLSDTFINYCFYDLNTDKIITHTINHNYNRYIFLKCTIKLKDYKPIKIYFKNYEMKNITYANFINIIKKDPIAFMFRKNNKIISINKTININKTELELNKSMNSHFYYSDILDFVNDNDEYTFNNESDASLILHKSLFFPHGINIQENKNSCSYKNDIEFAIYKKNLTESLFLKIMDIYIKYNILVYFRQGHDIYWIGFYFDNIDILYDINDCLPTTYYIHQGKMIPSEYDPNLMNNSTYFF